MSFDLIVDFPAQARQLAISTKPKKKTYPYATTMDSCSSPQPSYSSIKCLATCPPPPCGRKPSIRLVRAGTNDSNGTNNSINGRAQLKSRPQETPKSMHSNYEEEEEVLARVISFEDWPTLPLYCPTLASSTARPPSEVMLSSSSEEDSKKTRPLKRHKSSIADLERITNSFNARCA